MLTSEFLQKKEEPAEPARNQYVLAERTLDRGDQKFFQCQDPPVTRPWKNAANCGLTLTIVSCLRCDVHHAYFTRSCGPATTFSWRSSGSTGQQS